MNKLHDQTSPYLLQHADNPVEWYPWGPEALDRARAENRPILLSIGYSACHWCHVMAHESFEDTATAAVMNEHFINIKVDREERPDLDRIYQAAHQLLTRNQGGWPLTMFLSPDDHVPFFGGTYFPREARHGLPGFRDVLTRVAAAHSEHDEQIREYKAQMIDALAQAIAATGQAATELDDKVIDRACAEFTAAFDETHGGFGGAPKFPHPSGLELLMSEYTREKAQGDRAALLHMVEATLSGMGRGGIFDHLGGGFCRYSVDAGWTIPHFEKMLYDNGPLLELYAHAWALTDNAFYAAIANDTAGWMLREMRSPAGGFYSSLDADSEGEEGRYYVWTPAGVREVVGDDYDVFAASYGLTGPANFEGRWHLRLPAGTATTGAGPDAGPAIGRAKRRLLEHRERRVRPDLDDKILSSWNALAIRGLARAGQILGRADCIEAAAAAVRYIESVHWKNGRLLATSRDGVAHLNAYLDDHAFLIDALLVLLQARWNSADLAFAQALAASLLDRFEDAERGGFFFTSVDHERLIQRSKTFTDDSTASGNAVAARALLGLAHLAGDARCYAAAERTLQAAMGGMSRWPTAHAAMIKALSDYSDPPAVVVLRGSEGVSYDAWRKAAARATGSRGACYAIPADAELAGLLGERAARDGAAVTAYVCHGHLCSEPVTELKKLEGLLARGAEPA